MRKGFFPYLRRPLNAASWMLARLPRSCALALWRICRGWSGYVGVGMRYLAAKRLAASLGESVYLGPDLEIRSWERLCIGRGVSIHRWTYIDALGGVSIGDEVSIAHGCSILSFDHSWKDPNQPIRRNALVLAAVHIDRDVWVGCGVRILAGAAIGERSVVAAGAVVTSRFSGGQILGGVPARAIRGLVDSEVRA
jgi:acetyltransferase-like isoleucine patch superfamily enzyme